MLHPAIEATVSVLVASIDPPGIVDAIVSNVAISPEGVQRLNRELEQDGQTEVELFLRIFNADLLSSIQCVPCRVNVNADEGGLQAAAKAEKRWVLGRAA